MITQPAVPDHVEYLTMREAADRYHVSVMTLRRRIRTGALPAVHCGSKLIRMIFGLFRERRPGRGRF